MRTWRQFHLVRDNEQLRCWLEDDGRLKIGTRLTLKRDTDEERIWTIDERSEMTLNRPPTKEWNVGGLAETGRS